MFLYIPRCWFTLNAWCNPNHHLLKQKTPQTQRLPNQVSVLLEANYIIVKLSDLMMKFIEMLHQTPNSSETRPTLVQIPWSLRRWHRLVLPRFIPFDNSGWGEISSNSPREKQGSLYDTHPNNALLNWKSLNMTISFVYVCIDWSPQQMVNLMTPEKIQALILSFSKSISGIGSASDRLEKCLRQNMWDNKNGAKTNKTTHR